MLSPQTEITAANKDQVLLTIPKAGPLPSARALGDTTTGIGPTTGSGEALSKPHRSRPSISTALPWNSNSPGSRRKLCSHFSKAAELDPNFARAYAGLASLSRNMGNPQDAEKYLKLAMEHVDRMTERERYRIRGLYYLRSENWEKVR